MNTINDKLEEMKKNLQEMGKQPVFFIGSGLSRRYLNTPNWEGLLEKIAERASCDYEEIKNLCNGECEKIAQELEYYCFRNAKDKTFEGDRKSHRNILRDSIVKILREYRGNYTETSASERNKKFSKEICDHLKKIRDLDSPDEIKKIQNYADDYNDIAKEVKGYSDDFNNLSEIVQLRKISPKAIITTNYDTLLENIIFKNKCQLHIGQEGFSDNYSEFYNLSNSENKIDLYKIHGCVTQPDSIIITKEDYDNFFQKSKYLYSKILTLFWEYPVIFIGYSISDRNIRDILTVMIEIMTEEQKENFLKHMWIVDFVKHEEEECGTDKEIELEDRKSVV